MTRFDFNNLTTAEKFKKNIEMLGWTCSTVAERNLKEKANWPEGCKYYVFSNYQA